MLLTRKIGINGGTYRLIMATALEATPRRARGIVAGFTQQGFAAGYMLASGFHLAMSKIPFTPSFHHLHLTKDAPYLY
jgi:SHS family lactate transporter-like MFS transporter